MRLLPFWWSTQVGRSILSGRLRFHRSRRLRHHSIYGRSMCQRHVFHLDIGIGMVAAEWIVKHLRSDIAVQRCNVLFQKHRHLHLFPGVISIRIVCEGVFCGSLAASALLGMLESVRC